MADRKVLSHSSYLAVQPEGSIRKMFDASGAFGVDPYRKKVVYKTDDQGRTYRDFDGYMYSEDDLMTLLEAQSDPNEGFSKMVDRFIAAGKDPLEAVAMGRALGHVPYLNYEYVEDDMRDALRDVRDDYQEGDMLGAIASGGLAALTAADTAATYAPFAIGPMYRGAKSAIKNFKVDRADVARPPQFGYKRIEPTLTRRRGILE